MMATAQKANRARRVHTRTLCTDAAHDAPAMVPMPEMTPSTDHAPNRVTWMLYSRSEEVRSAITPHRNIKGLNAIHFSPDRRDFQLKPTGCSTGAVPTPYLIGRTGATREGLRLARVGQSTEQAES
jgi:hypothetical protein